MADLAQQRVAVLSGHADVATRTSGRADGRASRASGPTWSLRRRKPAERRISAISSRVSDDPRRKHGVSPRKRAGLPLDGRRAGLGPAVMAPFHAERHRRGAGAPGHRAEAGPALSASIEPLWRLREVAGDREADAEPAVRTCQRAVGLAELVEGVRGNRGVMPCPVSRTSISSSCSCCGARRSPVPRAGVKLDRVGDEVPHDPAGCGPGPEDAVLGAGVASKRISTASASAARRMESIAAPITPESEAGRSESRSFP